MGTGNQRQMYHTVLPLCITVSLWNIVQDLEKAGFLAGIWYPRQESKDWPNDLILLSLSLCLYSEYPQKYPQNLALHFLTIDGDANHEQIFKPPD